MHRKGKKQGFKEKNIILPRLIDWLVVNLSTENKNKYSLRLKTKVHYINMYAERIKFWIKSVNSVDPINKSHGRGHTILSTVFGAFWQK